MTERELGPQASVPGLQVRRQVPADRATVREVVAAAFDDPSVAALALALADRPGSAGLLAVVDETTPGPAEPTAADTPVAGGIGHVGLSRGWLDAPSRVVDVLVLSPLSVLPRWQRRGVGRTLVAAAVAEARRQGAPLLFLEGDPAYYSRLGFVPAVPLALTPPSVRIPEPAFQVVVLPTYEPWMTGALVYSDVFWSHDAVGLREDDPRLPALR